MAIDESFKKPGAIPFKWEIKPGLPKHRQSPPRRPILRPPPATAEEEPRGDSFRSAPRARSDRWRSGRAEVVSVGCFPASPLLKRMPSAKNVKKSRRVSDKNDGVLNFETTPPRWSVSSRKSVLSPFQDSTTSSFCSSSDDLSSPTPRPVGDAEWAAFGLF